MIRLNRCSQMSAAFSIISCSRRITSTRIYESRVRVFMAKLKTPNRHDNSSNKKRSEALEPTVLLSIERLLYSETQQQRKVIDINPEGPSGAIETPTSIIFTATKYKHLGQTTTHSLFHSLRDGPTRQLYSFFYSSSRIRKRSNKESEIGYIGKKGPF